MIHFDTYLFCNTINYLSIIRIVLFVHLFKLLG